MDNNLFQPQPGQQPVMVADADTTRTFLARVFTYMGLAMVISGGVAWWFGHDSSMLSYLINFETGKQTVRREPAVARDAAKEDEGCPLKS